MILENLWQKMRYTMSQSPIKLFQMVSSGLTSVKVGENYQIRLCKPKGDIQIIKTELLSIEYS